MSEASAHDQYNSNAEEFAGQIHSARASQAKRTGERPAEEVFPPFNRAGLGVYLEYERMGNRPVSETLEADVKRHGLTLEHLGITLGTIVHGIDLKTPLDDEQISVLRRLLLERKVIFFRNQHLTEDEQVAFGRYFGELDVFPFGKTGENPFILEIVHDRNSPGAENSFHTDVTWMEQPSLGSIAQCVEMPPLGGDTLFSDSHACYLGMPAELQHEIEHLDGVHDYRIFLGRLPAELVESLKSKIPFGVSHPLLRTHPETGKTGLYIHGGFLRHDSLFDRRTGESIGAEVSRRIVRELLKQHERQEYICRFQWEPGSIAFWDNRAVQHYAASDYFPHRRVLRRVTVSGDRPYYQPA